MSQATSMQALFQFIGLQPSLFAANSRYHGIETATLDTDVGVVAYIKRRFLPQADDLTQVQQHIVVEGDRLDLIAAQYLDDPKLFWRLCDANGAMRPAELTAAVGTVLRVCLPAGVLGGSAS
jgi:hypothetical protein